MSCDFYKELIFKKLDNDINDEEEKRLLEHLKSCKDCQMDYIQLNEVEDIINSQQMVEVPDSFSQSIMDNIKTRPKKRFAYRPIFTVAAACVVLILAYYSHAFDSLLSSGNIVQKQNTDNTSTLLQDDINNKLQGNNKEQISGYLYSTATNKKADENSNELKQTPETKTEETQTQKQEHFSDSQVAAPAQKSIVRAESEYGASTQEAAGNKELTDIQNQPQDSVKIFSNPPIATTDDGKSMYKFMASVTTNKQEFLDILKKYSVAQKNDLEYELLKGEYDKLYVELKSKNIKVEIKELNVNSDVILLVIIDN